MIKRYCYKIKHGYLKLKDYVDCTKAKIEDYGFKKMYSQDNDIEGWAVPITIDPNSSIGKWNKSELEKIYKKGEEKWLKELSDSGFEFDENGELIINDKFKEGLNVHLCIVRDEGKLFINMGSFVEFYDKDVLDECAKDFVDELLSKKVIYKKINKD